MSTTVYRSSDPSQADSSVSDTRRRIVEVALKHFEASGYEAATVRAIAEELGVTTPALYYHFANKDAILEAAVSPYLEEVAAMLSASEQDADPGSLLSVYAGILNRHRPIARFLYRDLSASKHHLIKDLAEAQLTEIRRRLSSGSEELGMRIRVAAALGALRRPFVWLDDDVEPYLDELVAIAAGILAASPAPARKKAQAGRSPSEPAQ